MQESMSFNYEPASEPQMDVTATDVDGQSVLHCAAGHEAASMSLKYEPASEAARQSTLLRPSTPGGNSSRFGHEAGHEASGHVQLGTGGRDVMGDVVSALVAARANIHAQDARLAPFSSSLLLSSLELSDTHVYEP